MISKSKINVLLIAFFAIGTILIGIIDAVSIDDFAIALDNISGGIVAPQKRDIGSIERERVLAQLKRMKEEAPLKEKAAAEIVRRAQIDRLRIEKEKSRWNYLSS